MNTKLKCLLPAVYVMAVGLMFADTKPAPALVVQVVQTDNPDAYVTMLVEGNALIKARTGLDKLRHTWEGDFAGEDAHGIFVVSPFESAAAAAAVTAKLKDDPEVNAFLAKLKPIRHLGPAFLYKAVRYEGVYDGGAVFNTTIACTDEAAYVQALDGLKAILEANGFKDARLNLWRLAAGRTDQTHLVVIGFPTQTRVGELIDAISDKAILKEWNVGAAKIRTTLHNGTYHEITK